MCFDEIVPDIRVALGNGFLEVPRHQYGREKAEDKGEHQSKADPVFDWRVSLFRIVNGWFTKNANA